MTFNELQKTWQSQQSNFELKIDSNMLLGEVKRNKRYFESAVFWRDVREVGAAVVAFFVFLYFGFKFIALPVAWSLFLLALLTLWIAAFLVTDRFIQKKKQPKPTDSLVSCIESSLAQVNHQIWLLQNVLWWYLLPPSVGIAVFVSHVTWLVRKQTGFVIGSFIYVILVILLYWGIYHVNQRAVRKELKPRKDELYELLKSLKNIDK